MAYGAANCETISFRNHYFSAIPHLHPVACRQQLVLLFLLAAVATYNNS